MARPAETRAVFFFQQRHVSKYERPAEMISRAFTFVVDLLEVGRSAC